MGVGSESESENGAPRESPPHKRHEEEIRRRYRGKKLPNANRRWVVLPRWTKEALEESNREVLEANARRRQGQVMAEGSVEVTANSSRGASHAASQQLQQPRLPGPSGQLAPSVGGSMHPHLPLRPLADATAHPARQFTFLSGLPPNHPSGQPQPPTPRELP